MRLKLSEINSQAHELIELEKKAEAALEENRAERKSSVYTAAKRKRPEIRTMLRFSAKSLKSWSTAKRSLSRIIKQLMKTQRR